MTPLQKPPPKAHRKTQRLLSQKAYEQLKSMILSNKLQGGRYMLEEEVNEIVGMSRTPLRGALAKLEHEGLISIFPRRGIRIMTLTLDDLFEIYRLLEVIEALAIKTLVNADDHSEKGKQLLALIDTMEAALDNSSLNEWAEAYAAFHKMLVSLTNMKRLEKLAGNLLDQSHRVRVFTLRLRDQPVNVNTSQHALAEAIKKGDEDLALELNRRHSTNRLVEIAEIFEKFDITQL